jgi:MFS transporter, DHA1 family, multidrug resistance protein
MVISSSTISATHNTLDQFRASPYSLMLLVGLLAVQPISTDLYLPALPSLSRAFNAPTATVTWTLSALIGTFGLSQLFMGPLADRFGRRPVALIGLVVYAIASFAALFMPVIEGLIICRAVQGLGVACGYVVSRAMVRDLYAPLEGAKWLSRGLTLMSAAPLLGPLIGGLLDARFGWQGPFYALTLFSVSMALLVWRYFPETNLRLNPAATQLAPLIANYRSIAQHPVFLSYTALSVASYAGLFAFLSGSSFVFITIFGMSSTSYGFVFGFTGMGYLLGTRLCRYLVAQRGVASTVRIAGLISLTAGSAIALLALLKVQHPLAVLLPCIAYIFAHGVQQPCTQTACVGPFPSMAGAASALNGFSQMAAAIVISVWIGKSFNGTTLPLALTMFAASAMVAFAGLVLVRRYGQA